jgi:hypothetical protein
MKEQKIIYIAEETKWALPDSPQSCCFGTANIEVCLEPVTSTALKTRSVLNQLLRSLCESDTDKHQACRTRNEMGLTGFEPVNPAV